MLRIQLEISRATGAKFEIGLNLKVDPVCGGLEQTTPSESFPWKLLCDRFYVRRNVEKNPMSQNQNKFYNALILKVPKFIVFCYGFPVCG